MNADGLPSNLTEHGNQMLSSGTLLRSLNNEKEEVPQRTKLTGPSNRKRMKHLAGSVDAGVSYQCIGQQMRAGLYDSGS